MPTKKHILDPDGDVIIRLSNPDAPFAVLQENGKLYVSPPPTPFRSFAEGQQQQPKSPSDSVELEPVRAATVTSEPEKKSSAAPLEVHLQVSSAHLRLASCYFEIALGGPFKESRRNIDGVQHVDASDWDTKALLIVLRIIHGRNRQVPRNLNLEMLAKIAVIVDYYKCHEISDAFAEIWHQRIKSSLAFPASLDRNAILLLHVSWVFRWPDEFKAVTELVLHRSEGLLNTLNLPIPEKITFTINQERQEFIGKIKTLLENMITHLRMKAPECSFECASMNLGALSRQIYSIKELKDITSSDSFDGCSVASAMEAARKIRSPDWSSSCRYYSGLLCRLEYQVKLELDKLGTLYGLDLKKVARDL